MSGTVNRIRISQTDARALANGVRAPLGVGIVRRDAPSPAPRGYDPLPPRLGIAVKLTLRFDGDTVRVADAEPLLAGSDEATGQPSDFELPLADGHILVEGHAHSDTPTEAIDAQLGIGRLTFRFAAASGAPDRSIPLESKSRLFPVDGLEKDAAVVLVGLSPRANRRELRLPGLFPRAWLDQTVGRTEIPLRCDTLHIDTDFETIRSVWRGDLPERWTDFEIEGIVVSLEGRVRDEQDVMRSLPRGTFSFAEEEGPAPKGDPDELEMASYDALEHAADPEISLEGFAAISARVAEDDRPRKDVLADHDLDERSWAIEERAWMERMSDRAAAGDGTLAAEYGERFVAEQSSLAGPTEPRPREEYDSIRAALDDSDQPAETLKARGIRFGEWCRLERHWGQRS